MEAIKRLECDLAHWQGERAAEIGSATMHPLALGDIAVSNHLTLQRDVIVMLHRCVVLTAAGDPCNLTRMCCPMSSCTWSGDMQRLGLEAQVTLHLEAQKGCTMKQRDRNRCVYVRRRCMLW
jgi:hypothetical protein